MTCAKQSRGKTAGYKTMTDEQCLETLKGCADTCRTRKEFYQKHRTLWMYIKNFTLLCGDATAILNEKFGKTTDDLIGQLREAVKAFPNRDGLHKGRPGLIKQLRAAGMEDSFQEILDGHYGVRKRKALTSIPQEALSDLTDAKWNGNVEALRKELGIKPLPPTKVRNCLKCGNPFHSEQHARLCPVCTKENNDHATSFIDVYAEVYNRGA